MRTVTGGEVKLLLFARNRVACAAPRNRRDVIALQRLYSIFGNERAALPDRLLLGSFGKNFCKSALPRDGFYTANSSGVCRV
jgi:hypothetical protein